MICVEAVERDVVERESSVLHHIGPEVTVDTPDGIVIVMVVCNQDQIRSCRRRFDSDRFSIMRIYNNGSISVAYFETGMSVPFDAHTFL